MIIKYSDNIFKQIGGILFYNKVSFLIVVLLSTAATAQYILFLQSEWGSISLPIMPVSVLGGALAIFLGFRNNSAYDRWWEARKIWGGIVNISRTFGTLVLTYGSNKFSENVSEQQVEAWKKSMIHRHIGWLYALKMHLRKEDHWDEMEKYISPEEIVKFRSVHNKPTQILHKQGVEIQQAFDQRIIEDFRHMELMGAIKEIYDMQGMAERIKTTIFPYYYNYFTNVFLWLFIICLPFTLASQMGWGAIAMSTAISFVFIILEKTGSVTEDPFEGRASDTPISAITRNIEIDLLEMLGSDQIPDPKEIETGTFGVKFIR